MDLRSRLIGLAKIIAEQADRDPDFAKRLSDAIGLQSAAGEGEDSERSTKGRPRNRRPPAALDPVNLARSGEETLRSSLEPLTLEQLRDIVAEHGMDPGKLVMKWKSPEKVIDRIVEISLSRAQKGDAFRAE